MSLTDMETAEALFALWRAERPEYVPFSDDGILIPLVWKAEKPKIAFILKESNDDFYDIRGKSHGPNGNCTCFWRNINMWSYVLKQAINGNPVTFEGAYERKEDVVGHVAYVNLKKYAQHRSVANDADIAAYVQRDWPFIDRQISLIGPDVLMCGGTFKYISGKLGVVQLGDRLYKAGGTIVVDFHHPAYWQPGYQANFDYLCQILSKLPKS